MKQKQGVALVVAGVDAGSTAIKVTLYDGRRLLNRMAPAGWNPKEAAAALLQKTAVEWEMEPTALDGIVGTGYGRNGLSFVTRSVTEITCHGRGSAYLQQGCRTVIDIGGQDAKAIRIDEQGRVVDFVMNDKCAAGTGRFLQTMAQALDLDVAELSEVALAATEACTINAMCTVFAESEVIGLLNRGCSRPAIVAGLHRSVANRVGAMAARVSPIGPVTLTGGVAVNDHLRQELARNLGLPVHSPAAAVFAGSTGAALIAWDMATAESGKRTMPGG
ncbi:MAG TPA: acyl-CoA dehydratase activase [Patescibacteria group bacterium]|nr:acyl-CoA dehydratase activase [Patescibacteria group bacterium]